MLVQFTYDLYIIFLCGEVNALGFRSWYDHFKRLKREIGVSCIIFLIGLYLGYSNQFPAILNGQLSRMEGIANSISNMEHSQLWLFVFIFANNVILSLLVMYTGAFFAIAPIYFLIMNGMVLGYLASTQFKEDKWLFFIKGILPHGIIEIPAVIVACAYGIRFGTHVAEGVISLPFRGRRAHASAKLIAFMKHTIPFMLVLSGSLLLAAIIESTLTLWLVR